MIGGVYKIIAKLLAEKLKKRHTPTSGQIEDDIYKRQINHGCTADRK